MRTQANGVAVPSKTRPQVIDPDQIDELARLHEAPHSALPVPDARRWRPTAPPGMPPMRQLGLVYPRDAERSPMRRRVHARPRPPRGPGARARRDRALGLSPARALGRSLALGRLSTPAPATIELRQRRVLRGQARRDRPRAARGAAADGPRRRGHPDAAGEAWTRSRRTAKGVPGLDRLADSRRRLRLLGFPRGRSSSRHDRERDRRAPVAGRHHRRQDRRRYASRLATLKRPSSRARSSSTARRSTATDGRSTAPAACSRRGSRPERGTLPRAALPLGQPASIR